MTLDQSPDRSVRELAAGMRGGGTGFQRLALGGRASWAAYAPIPAAGWSVGLVMPEAAMLQPADEVRATITAGADSIARQFGLTAALVLFGSLTAGMLMNWFAIRPLVGFTRKIERLNWDNLEFPDDESHRRDEIGQLFRRFRAVIGVLRRSRDEVVLTGAELAESNARLAASNEDLVREIEDRGRAEEELARQRDLLEVMLESIGDGLIASDPDGRVRLLNPAASLLTGWSEMEASGRTMAEVFPLCPLEGAAGTGSPPDRTLEGNRTGRLITRDGRQRTVAYSVATIKAAGQTDAGSIVVFRDVSESLRMEQEMARIGRLETVKVLAAGIAHDFNNLLSVILGHLSLARGGTVGDVGESLARAEQAVGRARDLTMQLLTFASGGDPVRTAVGLTELLRETVGFMLCGSGSQCLFRLEENLFPVSADGSQISQVVQNLVLNADQAMPGGGTIVVAARNRTFSGSGRHGLPAGRYVEVSVSDEGTGIAAEHLSRIFDPFYTTKARGTGLGLSVCQSIVAKHGGSIEAESRVGHGSIFRFWLPAAVEAIRQAEAGPRPDEIEGRRFLVMDDEPMIREVVRAMIENLGASAETAADGRAAVEAYLMAREAGLPFDGLILDLTVPGGIGGVETIARLRQIEPAVRAVASSGYSTDPVMSDPAAFGFVGVMPKPYTLETLSAVLGSLVRPGVGEGRPMT